jgi:hypothetical protein
VTWPNAVNALLEIVRRPLSLREAVQSAAKQKTMSTGDVLRALEILLAAGLVAWK